MKIPSLLQKRFVWNAGQWPLLMAIMNLYLFWAGGWFVAPPLAIVSLLLGIRSRFTFYSVSAVVLSIFTLLWSAFFLTPLYNLINP